MKWGKGETGTVKKGSRGIPSYFEKVRALGENNQNTHPNYLMVGGKRTRAFVKR